jgi:hypothetical protein
MNINDSNRINKMTENFFVLLTVIYYPNYQSILSRYFSARSEKEHEYYYVACTFYLNTLCGIFQSYGKRGVQ